MSWISGLHLSHLVENIRTSIQEKQQQPPPEKTLGLEHNLQWEETSVLQGTNMIYQSRCAKSAAVTKPTKFQWIYPAKVSVRLVHACYVVWM